MPAGYKVGAAQFFWSFLSIEVGLTPFLQEKFGDLSFF